jgi:regulator of protease activity HflC (stomatin/prohibitin superfamily)
MEGVSILIIILVVFLFYFLSGLKVINQYERGIILTLGKFNGNVKQPGFRIIWPGFQKIIKVDVRSTPIDVPKQEVITRDNVTVNVDAVVYFRVVVPEKAVLETTNYIYATSQFAQAALRDVTGNVSLDDLLSKRDEISDQIKGIVDRQTEPWGIDVEAVKIQNIELPQDMKRAMAKQAEADRQRRATIINADGEKTAAKTLAEAAETLSSAAGAINLRTLNTLERISAEPSQKTMVLFPVEILDALRGKPRG